MAMRVATPAEALRMLDKAGKLHAGQIKLPQNIVDLKLLIEQKTRNAEGFTNKTGAIDENMVREIVGLKLELDRLYFEWGLE